MNGGNIDDKSADKSAAISLAHISRKYGRVYALSDVSLTVRDGGITAVLGPNGAGKTTLINILLGLVRPSRGKAAVFGTCPGAMAARRRIGAMLQDTELPENLTVAEHIALFAGYYDTPRPLDDCLALAGLSDLAGRRYDKLSGGQKRRVQFAAALAGNPDLVFLDEPTTGLDLDARQALWRVVKELADSGVTIILTTHYLEEADALADRIVVINRGTIVADDTAPAIRARVGGKKIRCLTTLDEAALASLPAVRALSRSGSFTDLLTSDEVATLRALLAGDPTVSDISVSGAGLEDAFRALTQNQSELGDAA